MAKPDRPRFDNLPPQEPQTGRHSKVDPRPGKSPEHALPVAQVAQQIKQWVDRLGHVWVEGQIVQLNRRGNMRTAFATLRDPDENSSLAVALPVALLDQMPTELVPGSRVIIQATVTFWTSRGSLQLEASQIRPVGLGDLLLRLEELKQRLASEGLFDPARKRPLPFTPKVIGLITGRNSDAMKDVITNARRRWPPAQFAVREVAVQGEQAARQVIAALTELDADPAVEVIVIARGGGGVEDLLPFSDQALLRAVAAANTPVVSAIGHEADSPLLDLVADLRASTPTDAGKRIVPDLPHELDALSQATTRLRAAINRRWLYEQDRLDLLHDRPALARPQIIIERYQVELDSWKLAGRRGLDQRINQANNQLASLNATLRALSPKATLARGYAVVTTTKGQVIRQASDVKAGSDVLIRLAKGQVRAQVH